jgi:mortality factor 4-like protein 1
MDTDPNLFFKSPEDREEVRRRRTAAKMSQRTSSSKIIDADYESLPVKIPLPPQLKKKLSDEQSIITQGKELIPLPRTPSASDILDHWARDNASDDTDVLAVTEMLKALFREELGSHLLYRLERLQYAELVARNPHLTVDKSYGAEHLLRLFVILPWFLSNAQLEEDIIHSVKLVVTNLMEYMRQNMSTFFTQEYEPASPETLQDAGLG